MHCGNSGRRRDFPVSEYSVLVLSIANPNAKLVRLGTEYARFTENLLYVEIF